MLRVASRYTHVPLAVFSVLALLVVIAWLLVHRADGLWGGWDPPLRFTAPPAPVLTIAAQAAPVPSAPTVLGTPGGGGTEALQVPAPIRPLRQRAAPTPRYVLESGPFASPEAADRLEDQLNRLGHATVRFRRQEVTRRYVVAATGFAAAADAERAIRELGRGGVVETAGALEVVVDRLPSLGDAIAASRPLRARGFEVRVHETISGTPIYYVRFGQFGSWAGAEAIGKELARSGVRSRVAKIR